MSFEQFGEIIDQAPSAAPTAVPSAVPVAFQEFGEVIDRAPIKEPTAPGIGTPAQRLTGRLVGQLGLRGLESIISTPRAVGEFVESFVPTEALIKGAGKIGLGKGAETLIEATKKYAPYKLFPTEEQAREFTKDLFGDLFEPKNKAEEVAGETFGEFASLVFPFLGAVKPLKAFLLTTGANAAKETGEALGLDKKTSNLMKLGTYVLGSFIQPKAAEKFYKKNYQAARDVLPQNAKVDTTRLATTLDELESGFKKGGISSADTPALKQLENLRGQMEGALTPVDSLVEFKKKINIARGDIFKQLEGNKPGIRTANRNLEMVSNAADKSLEKYAKQNPTWGKFYREANNAFAAVQNSRKAAKFLKGKIPKLAISHAGLSLLLGHLGGLKTILKAGVGVAAGVPAYQAAQTLNQIMRSKPLRKEFFKLYQEAVKGNLPAISKSAAILDKGLQKLDE